MTTISGVPASFPQVELPTYPTAELNVTYTDFKKIATLKEKNKDYYLTYGVDDQRRMSVYKVGGATKLTRYYLSNYEEEIGVDGKVRKIYYLSGAILIQNEGKADSLLYTYSDAQGSLIALTNDVGGIVRRYAYDPWGARRDADNWNVKEVGANLIINRGYTGHEHLDAFGIINMNGRVYDPLTAQFFSPDPYVQAPGNWVNYNRYGYCMNNPFSYTDPSGYSWLSRNWKPILTTAAAIGVGVGVFVLTGGTGTVAAVQVAAGILAASAASGTGAVLGTALNGGSFGDCIIAGTKGIISGGANAMGTAGIGVIGDVFGHTVGTLGHELLRAGAHATINGLANVAQGGDFGESFAVGVVSSLVGSSLQAAGVGRELGILASGLAGAGTSAIMGGDPIKGLMQGVAIGALNHYVQQPNGSLLWEGPEAVVIADRLFAGHTAAWWAMSSGAINQVNIEFDVILAARMVYNAASVAASASASEAGANTVVSKEVAVHGNSLSSPKPTWGYKLYSEDGTFLKNGITNKVNPQMRYTKAFMSDKYMVPVQQFPNRLGAYQWEFQQNQIMRGPLNLNMH